MFTSYYDAICSRQEVLNNREGRRYISIYILQEKPKYTTYASFKNTYGHRSRVHHKVKHGATDPEYTSPLRPFQQRAQGLTHVLSNGPQPVQPPCHTHHLWVGEISGSLYNLQAT